MCGVVVSVGVASTGESAFTINFDDGSTRTVVGEAEMLSARGY